MNWGGITQCKLRVNGANSWKPGKNLSENYAEPRNICGGRFVYTSAAGSQAVAGWKDFVKEKPRGGSRGARDTQLFRLVKQEEEVSRS